MPIRPRSLSVLTETTANGVGRRTPSAPTTRTRPGFSVMNSRPSGAKAKAVGRSSPPTIVSMSKSGGQLAAARKTIDPARRTRRSTPPMKPAPHAIWHVLYDGTVFSAPGFALGASRSPGAGPASGRRSTLDIADRPASDAPARLLLLRAGRPVQDDRDRGGAGVWRRPPNAGSRGNAA